MFHYLRSLYFSPHVPIPPLSRVHRDRYRKRNDWERISSQSKRYICTSLVLWRYWFSFIPFSCSSLNNVHLSCLVLLVFQSLHFHPKKIILPFSKVLLFHSQYPQFFILSSHQFFTRNVHNYIFLSTHFSIPHDPHFSESSYLIPNTHGSNFQNPHSLFSSLYFPVTIFSPHNYNFQKHSYLIPIYFAKLISHNPYFPKPSFLITHIFQNPHPS